MSDLESILDFCLMCVKVVFVCTLCHDIIRTTAVTLENYNSALFCRHAPERGALWEGERWQAIRVAAV